MLTFDEITEAALALSQDDRRNLAELLDESLMASQQPFQLSPEWRQELQRRIEAVNSGEAKLSSWDEVKARVQATLLAKENA